MIGLIDADILVFRAGFAAERNYWFLELPETPVTKYDYKADAIKALDEALPGKYSREEGEDYRLWSERVCEPVENALHLVNTQMARIMEACALGEFDVMCYLSGGENFRYKVAKTKPYKGNRDKAHRPTHEDAIKDHIRSKWETTTTDGIEADDAIGLAMGQEDAICISIDKDLDMIPGLHYNFHHDVHYEITPDEGWMKFCLQLLTGDTTDNIPGLPGIGPAKAAKILDGIEQDELLRTVAGAYASKSGKREWFTFLQEQAALLWIQQPLSTEPPIPSSLGNLYDEVDSYEDRTDTPSLLY